jgi:hypothetical protein
MDRVHDNPFEAFPRSTPRERVFVIGVVSVVDGRRAPYRSFVAAGGDATGELVLAEDFVSYLLCTEGTDECGLVSTIVSWSSNEAHAWKRLVGRHCASLAHGRSLVWMSMRDEVFVKFRLAAAYGLPDLRFATVCGALVVGDDDDDDENEDEGGVGVCVCSAAMWCSRNDAKRQRREQHPDEEEEMRHITNHSQTKCESLLWVVDYVLRSGRSSTLPPGSMCSVNKSL